MVLAWVTVESLRRDLGTASCAICWSSEVLSVSTFSPQLLTFPAQLSSSSFVSWNFGSDLQSELALSLCFLWILPGVGLWCDE